MNTIITDSIDEAARFVRQGGIVAFPTETVYGLGADIFDEAAIKKIFEAKQRPGDNPLIVHISIKEQIPVLASELTQTAEKLIDAFFPGPLTVVLKKRAQVPIIATAGLETVGIRMPKHEIANAFLRACNTPLAAPSANLSGRPSPTTWNAVREDLDRRIDCILKGDAATIGLESTVVDCTAEIPVLLRPGSVSIDQLRAIVPNILTESPGANDARSPGMRHKHYSPRAYVELIANNERVDETDSAGYIGLHNREELFALKRICSDKEDYARQLFEFFRECDRNGISKIYCETVLDDGIGRALMDRLRRASER